MAGNGTTVKFAVEVPGAISTKAQVADGKNVNVVHYEIYKAEADHENSVQGGKALAKGFVTMENKKANVTFDLLSDQTYVAIFWAQVSDDAEKGENAHYVISDLRTISYKDCDIEDADAKGNAEDRAAFFRTYLFSTEQVQDHNVTLYRPFAQLNLGTTKASLEPTQGGTELEDYVIDVEKSTVTVTGLATTFNTIQNIADLTLANDVYCGEAGVALDAEFVFSLEDVISAGSITDDPRNCEYLRVTDKNGVEDEYEWVAMNYFFAATDRNVVVEYDIHTDKGVVNNTVENVPVKENFRTNIIGNLLTSKTDFEIVVDERFEQPDIIVIEPCVDYVVNGGVYEVYTAEGLAKWAYHVNYIDNTVSMRLMDNITLPNYVIVENHLKKTYNFSDEEITSVDGIPSGSNWVPVGNQTAFNGFVEGNGFTVSGLRINTQNGIYTGFISKADAGESGATANSDAVYIKDLNLDDAIIRSSTVTGAVVAYVRNIKGIDNCHLTNSTVNGGTHTGGLVAYLYTRQSDNNVILSNSSVDENSTIRGTSYTGGLVGYNYGSVIKGSTNASDVYGTSNVGGIVGYSRDYHHNRSSYVIGCGNTGSVYATQSTAGGIVGQNLRDNNHQGSEAGVVACWSTAPFITSSKNKALLVAVRTNTELHYGSWALTTADVSTLVASNKCTGCFAYDNVDAISQADVDAMNAAIDSYNDGRASEDKSYCPYKWEWGAGSLPVLK